MFFSWAAIQSNNLKLSLDAKWGHLSRAAVRCAHQQLHKHTLTTSGYVIGVVAVCLEVLTTRTELEQVSEIAEAENPMTALRMSRRGKSSY
jgi:hypothetical protein